MTARYPGNPALNSPNGSYLMSHTGIIRVADSIPELKSNYLTKTVAEREAGFIFEADPTVPEQPNLGCRDR